MQCLKDCYNYFEWKKILVRGTHLALVFGVVSSLVFQSSELNYAIHTSNYLYCFLYGSLVYVSLFFYFLTCYMNPGYVPSNKIHGSILTTDESEDDENDKELPTSDTVQLRKCSHCNILQPLRSHHCDYCHRCVRKYDHHCPYFDTCIGEYNHRYFLIFLLTTDLLILWSLIICSQSFIYYMSWSLWLNKNVFRLFSMHILAVSIVAVTILFVIHSYFMLTNTTTWEKVSRHRITYLKHLPEEEYNPFDQGYCRNIYLFLCKCRSESHYWNIVYRKHMEHVIIQM